MAFEVGAIKGSFQLKDEFSKPMVAIYDSVNKTLNKIAEIPKVAGDVARKTVSEVSRASNTINGLSGRVQRLQNLLNKSQIGSERFKQLNSALVDTQKQLGKTTGSLNKMNPALALAGSTLAAFSAVSVIKGIVDITARFEKYEVVLTKTLGTQSEAVKAMTMIQKVAAKTPFSVDQLTDSFVKFANRGVKPSAEEIERLGDVASVVGKDFDQLTEAILDVSNSERWKELGIVSEQAGNKLRLSFKGVTVEGEKTVQGAKDLVVQLGKMNGVLGANDAISGSAVGKFSNFGDAVDALYLSLGKLLLPTLKKIVEILIDVTNAVTGFIERNKELIKNIVLFATTFGTVIFAINLGTKAFVALQAIMTVMPALATKTGASIALAFGPASIAALAIAGLVLLFTNLETSAKNAMAEISNMSKGLAATGSTTQNVKNELLGLAKNFETINGDAIVSKVNFDNFSKALDRATGLTKEHKDQLRVWAETARNGKKASEPLIQAVNDIQVKTKAATSGTKDLNNAIKKLNETASEKGSGSPGFDFLPSEADLASFGSGLEAIFSKVSKFASVAFDQMVARLGNKLQNVLNKGKIFDLLSSVYLTKEKETNQKELDAYTALQNKEFEAFKARQEAELELERKRSNDSIALLTDEYIKRKELSDAEFADKKAKAELEFQNFVNLKRLEYEAQRQKVAQESVDKEQAQINDALLQEDWKRYLESLEAGHNENLITIAQEKTDASTALQAEEDAKRQTLQEQNDARLVALEKQKADAIAKAEIEKEERIFNKQEEIKAREKASAKKVAMTKYLIDVAALEVQKQIARAQAAMAFATGSMQAIAQAPMTFGASLALIPLMQNSYALAMSAISSQFVTPPAELFLAQGGVVVPGLGTGDTVPARLTPGEMVVDRSTTKGLQDMVETGGMNKGIVINFYPGSIVNSGSMDARAMDELSFEISRRLERSQARS